MDGVAHYPVGEPSSGETRVIGMALRAHCGGGGECFGNEPPALGGASESSWEWVVVLGENAPQRGSGAEPSDVRVKS